MRKKLLFPLLFVVLLVVPLRLARADLAEVAAWSLLGGAARTLEVHDRKEQYDSILPVFKLEADYQRLLQDVHGVHGLAELGIAFLGGDVEFTRYFESNPSQGFDIFSVHFLYRLALIKEAQLNIAVGYKKFWGDVQNDSLDIGFPLYLFPGKKWTIEARPFFSFINQDNPIVYDLQGGLRYKHKYVGVRGGYRFVHVANHEWHGPQIGLFFEW
ncbi:MAG: hypothetical protein HYT76_07825 [Deltaproteobacteria bacterium]|nr:hypothetical protein [Deltaproteobacteria bacterium]